MKRFETRLASKSCHTFKGGSMKRFELVTVLSFTLMAVFVLSGICETHVTGNVSGTWTMEREPYVADAALSIAQNDTLIIEPGVTVIFPGRYGFTISGILVAAGTEEDSIFFTARNQHHDAWIGLTFNSMRSSNSIFKYCSVKYAYRGISFTGASPTVSNCNLAYHENSGLWFRDSRAVVRNSHISDIHANGVSVEGDSRPTIEGCQISVCLDQGILVGAGSGAFIIGDTIRHITENGIALAEAEACSLRSCLITDVELQGIRVNQSTGVIVLRCIVDGSGRDGIWIYRSENVSVINSNFMNGVTTGMYVYESNVDVINNIIIRNGQDGIGAQGNIIPRLYYNCIWGNSRNDYNGVNAGNGDINESPDLGENYIPQEGSRVIDAGDARYRDDDGTRADIGARFFNQNHPPRILSATPEPFDELVGDQTVEFTVYAEDEDGHNLTYTWLLNDVVADHGNSTEIEFHRDGEYVVKVVVNDGFYMGTTEHSWEFTATGMAVQFEPDGIPGNFTISLPYPNPFNAQSSIDLSLKTSSLINLTIFDMQGRMVSHVDERILSAGRHNLSINSGSLPSGNYLVIFSIGSEQIVTPVTLIR